jgi:hypothetical protein
MTRETQGGLDVLGLGALITARQENDDLPPALLEIDPVTGALVDPQLRHTFADGLDIAGVPGGETFDPGLDTRPGLDIAQAVQPLGEGIGFAHFHHGPNCSPAATHGQWGWEGGAVGRTPLDGCV